MAYHRDDLAYGEEYRSSPNRWDRARFERARSRGPPVRELESFRFDDDRKYYGSRGLERERDVDVDVRLDRHESGPRRSYYEEDRSRNYYDDFHYRDDRGYASTGRELAPWRDRYDQPDYYDLPPRRSGRPEYGRRQSSWDAFDRRPLPRYGDREDEHDVDIDVRIRNDNRPPEPRFVEREYQYRDPREEDDYRDVRVVRERSIHRRAYDDQEFDRKSRRGRGEEEVEEEEEEDVKIEVKEDKEVKRWKKGYTRFPKRLAHRRAILEFGQPFEEEENFYVVKVALKKEDIDGIIRISESYKFEEKPKQLEAPPPAPTPEPAPQETEVTETITTKVIENPNPEEFLKYGIEPTPSESASNVGESTRSLAPPRSEAGRSTRSHKSKREERHHHHHTSRHGSEESSSTDDEEEESETTVTRRRAKHRGRSKSAVSVRRDKSRLRSRSRFVGPEREEVVLLGEREVSRSPPRGGGEIVLRERKRDIKEEIRRLEEQKRRLEDDRGGEVVIEKDRRGRLSIVRR